MSEKQPSPVIRDSASDLLIHPDAGSPDHPSAGKGIRLTTVRPGLSWESIDLPPGHYTLGSRADADLVIDAPGVADRHCTLIVGAQRNVVKALTSRTWINDGAVSEGTLRAGDRLILGPIELRVSTLTHTQPLSRLHRPFDRSPIGALPTPLVSEDEFQQLLNVRSISDRTPAPQASSAARPSLPDERILRELHHEIDSTLRDVLQKERDQREEFDRQRLHLSQRSQELNTQWEEIERIRAKLIKERVSLASTAEQAKKIEEQRIALFNQEQLLADRHEELASRSHALVTIHRRLKFKQQEQSRQVSDDSQQAVAIRTLLARNEAQCRQLTQRQKELDQREEATLLQSAELATGRTQLQEQTRHFEAEQRQWQGKCKTRERFLDDFELSLTTRSEELAEEELRQRASQHQIEQRALELDRRIQEIQLQQQGVDQATRLLEQQQTLFTREDAALNEQRQQLELGQTAVHAEKAELQTARETLEQERAELNRRADELQARHDELSLDVQDQQTEHLVLTSQHTELDTLREELESARERLQVEQSELSADQQNLQRLRGELDAERQRDVYERQQLQQTQTLLEQRRHELELMRQELVSGQEELARQQSELTFQLAQIPSPDQMQAASIAPPDAEELQQARTEIELMRQELQSAQSQLQSERDTLLEERDSLERRQNQIESVREQISQEQQQLQSLRSDVEQSRRELHSDQQELAESRHQLQADREELESLRRAQQEQPEILLEPAHAPEPAGEYASFAEQISAEETVTEEREEAVPAQTFLPDSVGEPASSGSDSAEDDAALQLRLKLASLFGMKADAAESAPAHQAPETEHRSTLFNKPEAPAPVSPAATSSDSSLRSHGTPQSEASSSSRQAPQESGNEEDSVAAYMERLLARSRRSTQQDEPAAQQTAPPPARPEPPQQNEQREKAEEESRQAVIRKNRKMDELQKKSIRSDLHSFREVANQSARTAVAKSHHSRKSNSLRYMIGLNVVGWLLTFALFIAEFWLSFSLGTDALTVGGISFCLTLLCLYRYKEIRRISLGSSAAESDKQTKTPAVQKQQAADSSEDKSSPLSFL